MSPGKKSKKKAFDSNSSVTVFQDSDNGQQRDVYNLADRMVNVIAPPAGLPHIRGIDGRGPTDGYLTYQSGARSRVATMIDGVAESWSGENFGKAGLWDVEQVEIYRGTQSMMQGRDAISGSIVVNTKMPTYHWEKAFRLGYENEDNKYHLGAMISGPVIADELAFRLAVDGVEGNTPIDYVKPKGKNYPWDPSQLSERNIRAKILWEPQAIAGLKTTFTISNRDSEGQYTNLVTKPYFDYVYDDGDYGTRHQYTDSKTYQLKTDYQFNKELSADIQLSRRDYHTTFRGFPRTDWFVDLEETNYALESKVSYNPSSFPMKAVAGVYLYNRDQEQLLDGFKTDDGTKSRAVYFDTDTSMTDVIGLQLGGRWQHDSQIRYFRDSGANFVIDTEKTVFLPSIGFTYSPQDNLKFGATLRKGYNPGGATHRSSNKAIYTFDEENVWTGELSIRSKRADGRVNLAANVFYSKYDHYQSGLSIPPVTGSSQRWNDMVVLNIPQARTFGLEANADIVLDTWILGAEIGLLSTRIEKAPDNKPELKGNKLTYAPAVSAGLSLEKFFSNGWSAGANVRYVDHYYDNIGNNASKAGGYTQLDVNATYQYGDDLTLRAYVNNANNAEYVYRYKGGFAEIGSPRTFGITLDYKF